MPVCVIMCATNMTSTTAIEQTPTAPVWTRCKHARHSQIDVVQPACTKPADALLAGGNQPGRHMQRQSSSRVQSLQKSICCVQARTNLPFLETCRLVTGAGMLQEHDSMTKPPRANIAASLQVCVTLPTCIGDDVRADDGSEHTGGPEGDPHTHPKPAAAPGCRCRAFSRSAFSRWTRSPRSCSTLLFTTPPVPCPPVPVLCPEASRLPPPPLCFLLRLLRLLRLLELLLRLLL